MTPATYKVYEWHDLPEFIQGRLEYFWLVDERSVSNGDYVELSFYFDEEEREHTAFDEWFLANGLSINDDTVLIHVDY